jgi:hypothetical protein
MAATAAEVLKKWGGSYPAGWDATSVGNVCTQVTAETAGKALPATFPTGTNADEFLNEYAWRKINYMRWAAGTMTQPAPLRPWDDEMEQWFQRLLSDTTVDRVGYVKQQ